MCRLTHVWRPSVLVPMRTQNHEVSISPARREEPAPYRKLPTPSDFLTLSPSTPTKFRSLNNSFQNCCIRFIYLFQDNHCKANAQCPLIELFKGGRIAKTYHRRQYEKNTCISIFRAVKNKFELKTDGIILEPIAFKKITL
ncbi:hypothetical protein P879_04098 [Paragonimus westermani]|uniref:Uncharacterized protein n=1 Tax=Paragonimus westermani TaxID=34504 RepID=A0A8T0DL36_9TREM|nr:hypothetical protein P879_04098 [Paragonimus westermani]